MKRKILFIGDVSRGGQAGNIYKLFRLFAPIFESAQIQCASYVSPINQLTDSSDWLESWRSQLNDSSVSGLRELNLDDTAIIGFEIPKNDLSYLNQQSVPWVNLEIHPLRFLDDLYFEVSSSFEYDLGPISADSTIINYCANVIRVRYGYAEPSPPEPTLIILGQAPNDRSVFFDGTFKNLDCYSEQLDRLASNHRRVIYRPHPYLSDVARDSEIFRRYGADACVERDIYKLFSSGKVATACAISSSTAVEAPYFGVCGELLEPRAKRYGAPISYGLLLDEHQFWLRGLLNLTDYQPYRSIGRIVPKNYLRDTFGYWGYLTREREIEARLTLLQTENQRLETSLIAMLNSRSWRVTAPLRWLDRLWRRA